jgi:hypothetical protein
MYGKHTKHSILTATCGFALGLIVAACNGSEKNLEHCYHAEGNQTCADRYGTDLPYCAGECDPGFDQNYGCVADPPTNPDCYSPCGGDQTATQDMSCLGTADDSTDSDTSDTADTTDATETETGPGPCVMDEDCTDADLPFCDDQGTCVDCSGTTDPNAACMGADPGMAVCSDGACVQCSAQESSACVETTPICDEGTNTCVGCSEHEQCLDSACNLELGNCMDVDNVVAVDGDDGQMYLTLADALMGNMESELTIILYERNNMTPYTESVLIDDAGTYVAILAAPGEKPRVQGVGAPGITVSAGSTAYLHGIIVRQGDQLGLDIDGASAWVQRCELVNNDGCGILVDGGGELVLENSFVGGNVTDVAALAVTEGTVEVVYSTVVAGAKVLVDPTALACTMGNGVMVRNSILVSPAVEPAVVCDGASITDSVLEDITDFPDNTEAMFGAGWFVNYAQGDFSINPAMAPAIVATAATWQAGDPATDIDGVDLRPTVPGTADYAGADIP